MGASLAKAGLNVTLFARGAHLHAMQDHGVQVRTSAGDWSAHPKVCAELESIGAVDVVFLAVKAHSLPELAPKLAPLFHESTAVVSMQNGVPWWFFNVPGAPYSGLHLDRLDLDGVISTSIEPRRVIGSIVYLASEIEAPGVVRHIESNRISLGEPDGSRTERVREIAAALIAAGLKAPVTTHLRSEIWVKLLGNMAFNPISALTGATLVRIANTPETRELVRGIMQEGVLLAGKLGLDLPVTIEQRIDGAAKIGEHKTSMLQDLEAGRPLELEAVTGAVLEIGEKLGVPMPHTRAVYACTKLLASARSV